MHKLITSILMVRDGFFFAENPDTGSWVYYLEEGATYNVGNDPGEVPAVFAFRLLQENDAAPHTVDGILWDTKGGDA